MKALSRFSGNDMGLVNMPTPDPDPILQPSWERKTAPKGNCITRAHDTETFIELKNREIDEPYCDDDEAHDAGSWLTSYYDATQY